MREIKFRGFCTDRCEFVNIIDLGLFSTKSVLEIAYTYDSEPYELYNSDVNDNIKLMQFTGLHDRNGTEIYEGDVLDKQGFWGYYVGFKNGVFVAIPVVKVQRVNWEWHALKTFAASEFAVIGNIHEQPELLEGME